jgi:hypothetical protein
LDRPKVAIALRKRDIAAYAAFCGTAPYILAALLISSFDLTNILPPDSAERTKAEIRQWENELSELRGESRVTCETTASLNTSAGRRCFALTSRMIEELQGETETMRREVEVFESLRSAAVHSIFGVIVIFVNAFVFARIWHRVYPMHARRLPQDVGKVWRAYLLVMSTTMFIPNCVGAFIFILINIVTRVEPWTSGGLSGAMFVAGVLPAAVCGVLGSYRLNEVLLHSTNWRVGHTWWVMAVSNIVTLLVLSVVVVPVLMILFMPLFM